MTEIINTTAPTAKNTKLFGIITIILGLLAIASPLLIGFSITLLVGMLVFLAGAARLFWFFQASSLAKDLPGFIFAILTLLCGIVMVLNPVFTSGFLTIILALYFIIDGTLEIMAAFRIRPLSGWVWLLIGGSISFLLGLMIWQQFPLSGAWAIGVLLGIKLLFVGVIMFSMSTTLQSAALHNSENELSGFNPPP